MVRAILLGSLLYASFFGSPFGSRWTLQAQERPERPDTLTVTEARRLALTQNPSFLAALERVAAARGDLLGARTYPLNPEIEVESPGSLTEGGISSYEVRFGQEVEWAGQRGLRISSAEAGLSAEGSRILDEARLLLARVERAYTALSAAEQRLSLAEEILGLNERLLTAVRTQLVEGAVSVLQANLAEIEAGRGRARVLSAGQDVSSAGLELGRLLGRSPGPILRSSETGFVSIEVNLAERTLDQLVWAALDARPDFTASLWEVERAGSLRSLASRESLPNLRLGTIADRDAVGQNPQYGLFLAVSLPVFQRNQGLRARRDAELREASQSALALELRVRKEIADALQSFGAANQEMRVFQENVLGPARQNQGLLETAYSEGKLDLSSLLLLRNQLLDAELEYWEAWERRQQALVNLREATATILDGAVAAIEEEIR